MNKIKLSNKFLNFCKSKNLDSNLVYLLQASLLVNDDCVNLLIDSVTNKQFELTWRMILCDPNEDGYVLRPNIPYFWEEDNSVEVKEEKSTFKEFIDKLLKSGLSSKGHPNSPKNYTVISKNKEVKEEFEQLCYRKKIDLDKLVTVISHYYETTEYAKKLDKVLAEIDFEYDSFKEEVIKPKYKGLK